MNPQHPHPVRSEEWYQWNRIKTQEDMARWKREEEIEQEKRDQKAARPYAIAFTAALKNVGLAGNGNGAAPKKRVRPAAILGGQSMLALEASNIPPREVLLSTPDGPLFFKQSVNQILAHRGTGKTLLGLSIAGALANGAEVLNYRSARPSKVTYVDGELPLSQLKERAGLLCSGDHKENLWLINPEMSKPAESIRLLDDYTWGQFCAMLDRHGSEVVVLDSYSTLFWLDANKEESQIGAQMRLNELRSRGLCVVALQHTGKDKKTQRGHSRNEDNLDTQILLDRPESAVAGGVMFDVSYPKVRHAGSFEPSGTWTLNGSMWEKVASTEEVGVREYLLEGKGINWIAKELGVGSRKVKDARQKMLAEGLLKLNTANPTPK